MLISEEEKNDNVIEMNKKDSENKEVLENENTTPDITQEQYESLLEKLKELENAKDNTADKELDDEAKLRKHRVEIEKIRLEGQRNRELRKIKNDEEIENIKADSEIFEAQQKAKALVPNTITSRLWGILLILIGIVGTIASTAITLSSGYKNYDGDSLAKFAFLSAIIVIQGSVFFLYCQKTKILTMYKGYATMFHVITKSLLTVSIYFNFIFFVGDFDKFWLVYVIIFLTCIMIDGISVYTTSLGMDYLALRVTLRNQIKSIPEMFVYNVFSKRRHKELAKYNENVADYNEIARLKGKSKYKAPIEMEHDFASLEDKVEMNNNLIESERENPVDNSTVELNNEEVTTKDDSVNEDIKVSKRERETYLKYIIRNKFKNGSIPSNTAVIKAYKDKVTINLNDVKINKIRDELYKQNVLIRPEEKGGKGGSVKTFFTKEYLEKLENSDGKTIPKISDKYEQLDKENVNQLEQQNSTSNGENVDDVEKENVEKVDEEKVDKNIEILDEKTDEILEEKELVESQ